MLVFNILHVYVLGSGAGFRSVGQCLKLSCRSEEVVKSLASDVKKLEQGYT